MIYDKLRNVLKSSIDTNIMNTHYEIVFNASFRRVLIYFTEHLFFNFFF